jgi:hypothetical protein
MSYSRPPRPPAAARGSGTGGLLRRVRAAVGAAYVFVMVACAALVLFGAAVALVLLVAGVSVPRTAAPWLLTAGGTVCGLAGLLGFWVSATGRVPAGRRDAADGPSPSVLGQEPRGAGASAERGRDEPGRRA